MKPATAELPQRSYALLYNGLKPGAQLAKLKPVFARRWQLDGHHLDLALIHPPHWLTTGADLAVLRGQQRQLGDLGCESELASIWRYRHWNIDSDVLKRIDGIAGETRVALALLHVSPAPGVMRLQWAARTLEGVVASTLNGAQLFLEFTSNGKCGYGQTLVALEAALAAALKAQAPHGPTWRCSGAVALTTDDGVSLTRLLDVLQERLTVPKPIHPEHPQDPQAVLQRPLAGRDWGRVVRWGLTPSASKTVTRAMARDMDLNWPLDGVVTVDAAHSVAESRLDLVMKHFSAGQAQRADHCLALLRQLGDLSQLPSLPELAMQVHRLACDPESDPDELARLVGSDPGLSSQVLSRVNSAYYGLRHRIDSVGHAVVILGFEELATLSLSLASQPLFMSIGLERGQRLWRHCALTADMARALAIRWNLEQRASLYTAGLLHDVGKVFLFHVRKAVMDELENEARKARLPLLELEREYFAHDHATLGAMLLREWGLPDFLARCVEDHHGPKPGADAIALESALVGVADHLAHRMARSEPWADELRLRKAHQEALRLVSGELNIETLDTLLGGPQAAKRAAAI